MSPGDNDDDYNNDNDNDDAYNNNNNDNDNSSPIGWLCSNNTTGPGWALSIKTKQDTPW